jgi:trk system potassium uptake protein TrkH
MKKKHNIFTPLRVIVISFLILIASGTLLLLIPAATMHKISFIDSIFTATSAVCVTGLSVLDTAKDFSLLGKIIILILFQLGGFGIMTFSMGFISMLGGNISLRWAFTFEDLYSEDGFISVRNILKRIVLYTFIIEGFTALILFTQFIQDFSFFDALGHSIFHAVSAFCNAGFSSFSTSLIAYQNNTVVITITSFAIITGGLGFFVIFELVKRSIKRKEKKSLSLHSKIVLITTFILLVSGTIIFYFLESDYSLKNQGILSSFLISFFQSTTCRTAGFNSIEISSLRESTHFLMIILMFIGGSPGSIAGGIKTTTIAVIFLLIFNTFKGRNQIKIFKRSIHHKTIERSTSLFILSLTFIMITIFTMLTIDSFDLNHSFLSIVFESVSAFGTVGLSMGITSQLPDIEKIILSIVMLIGRLGPLTLVVAMTQNIKKSSIEYPDENIMIG